MSTLGRTITYQQLWNLAVQLAGRTPDNVPTKEATMLQAFLAAELPDLWRKEAWPELCDHWSNLTPTNNAFSLTQTRTDTNTLLVTGAGSAQVNGTYTSTDGVTYTQSSGGGFTIVIGSGSTILRSASHTYYANTSSDPTDPSWAAQFGSGAGPTVAYATVTDEIGDVLGVYTLDPRTASGWARFEAIKLALGDQQLYVLPFDTDSAGALWVNWQERPPDLLSLSGDALNALTLPERFRLMLAFKGAAHLLATEDPVLANKYLNLAELELAKQTARLKPPWWAQEVVSR